MRELTKREKQAQINDLANILKASIKTIKPDTDLLTKSKIETEAMFLSGNL